MMFQCAALGIVAKILFHGFFCHKKIEAYSPTRLFLAGNAQDAL
jgi:hypothetical protein